MTPDFWSARQCPDWQELPQGHCLAAIAEHVPKVDPEKREAFLRMLQDSQADPRALGEELGTVATTAAWPLLEKWRDGVHANTPIRVEFFTPEMQAYAGEGWFAAKSSYMPCWKSETGETYAMGRLVAGPFSFDIGEIATQYWDFNTFTVEVLVKGLFERLVQRFGLIEELYGPVKSKPVDAGVGMYLNPKLQGFYRSEAYQARFFLWTEFLYRKSGLEPAPLVEPSDLGTV
jgi:hypothetical protein